MEAALEQHLVRPVGRFIYIKHNRTVNERNEKEIKGRHFHRLRWWLVKDVGGMGIMWTCDVGTSFFPVFKKYFLPSNTRNTQNLIKRQNPARSLQVRWQGLHYAAKRIQVHKYISMHFIKGTEPVWRHFPIYFNENSCPNFWLLFCLSLCFLAALCSREQLIVPASQMWGFAVFPFKCFTLSSIIFWFELLVGQKTHHFINCDGIFYKPINREDDQSLIHNVNNHLLQPPQSTIKYCFYINGWVIMI